jgi:Zn-dependent protease with chaperone function
VKNANSSFSNGDEKVTFAATDLIPHPISFAYHAGLLGVILGLLALPLIYFGLVAAIAFGVWFHLTHNLALFEAAGLWGLVAYIIPCIVGSALIWFMLRPFFIKRTENALPPREIKAVDEPIVFEFVERICDSVRAPRPKHVYVDLAANASASVNGVRGLLRRELNLTIGLPLVAALNVTQFGGVLAHEFGHFAQGAGMRLSFLIRTLNDWIARIAFQPDTIEQLIARKGGRGGFYGAAIAVALGVSLWITRRLLHAVLLLSHAISCYSMRQMEHDADLYETKIAGTDAFAVVTEKLRWLNEGSSRAMMLVERAASEGKCPVNLVQLINARGDAAKNYAAWQYDESAQQVTSWFDTHPSPTKRIAYVNRFSTIPVLVDERPANSLFVSFDLLARETSVEFYRGAGLPIENFVLEELDAFCEGEVLSPRQIVAVNRFFANRANLERPFSIGADELANADGADARELLRDWNFAREQTEPAFLAFARTRMRRLRLLRAQTLINARIRFSPRQFGLHRRSLVEIEQELQAAAEACAEAHRELAPFDVACHRRIAHALKSPNQTIAYSNCLDVLPFFEKIAPLYVRTYETFVCLDVLLASNRSYRPKTKAHRQMLKCSDLLKEDLELLAANLNVQDPVRSGMTIMERIASRLPSTTLPFGQQIFLEARECLSCLSSIYFQRLARICVVAAETECLTLAE